MKKNSLKIIPSADEMEIWEYNLAKLGGSGGERHFGDNYQNFKYAFPNKSSYRHLSPATLASVHKCVRRGGHCNDACHRKRWKQLSIHQEKTD